MKPPAVVAAMRAACAEHRIWGCFSIMERNPAGNPWNSGIIVDDEGGLRLYYPGSWNEGLSSGQGLIAVALVIFARWSPWRCLGAALLFGGAGAIGPALQSVGISGGYYLFNAVPYALTLAILVATCSTRRAIKDAPMELGVSK